MNKVRFMKRLRQVVYVTVLIFFFVILVFPFYYVLNISFMYERYINVLPIYYIPVSPTLSNYARAWADSNFSLFFWNTLLLSAGVLGIVTVISTMVGYAFSRYRFLGKGIMMVLFLITQMVPITLLLIPLFNVIRSLGLINTMTSVIITTSASLLAYCSIMMRGFFSNISVQLEQAAWIDGCSKPQAVYYVILPLLLPGLVATGSYAFVNAWNSFLLPLILLNDPNSFTLTLGLRSLIGQYTVNFGRLAAAGVICLVPAVLLFAYIQKHMVVGLTAGAIKG
ncbi:MAG: carbohydrate ABC transporter permease [Oscillospiraceae bacterium]|nr:carbohydrate ABC transporter permease [Oscillospiraceae bacterium]